ncbi:MAG: serine O-acetyltransferase EpsC [Oscillospiraceae bacterium]
MFNKLKLDISAVKQRDPAARNSVEVLLLYSGLHAIMWHRPAYWCYHHKLFFIARLISQSAKFFTGIEIHPGATIGRGVFIDHGSGVVIGETAEIGDNCTIYQGVTLGGTGKDTGKRHPTLESDVMVGTGAKILGPFTVHTGAKIAANAVVLSEVPAYSTCVGIPARVVRQSGEKIETPQQKLDHTHCPDPIAQELARMQRQIVNLEKMVAEMQVCSNSNR